MSALSISALMKPLDPVKISTGTTPFELLKEVNKEKKNKILGVLVNGVEQDMSLPLKATDQVVFLNWETVEGKRIFWHSSAHLMAEAILHFYPQAQLSIGPPIKKGFYYDIDFGKKPFDQNMIPQIEARILKMAKKKDRFIRTVVSKEAALAYYRQYPNPYKIDLINNFDPDETITFYQQGAFKDLCKGPHLPHTALVKSVQITQTAAAYWKGDSKNKQLTRIYGISFPEKKLMALYNEQIVEAKKRDHRKLGQQLELFTFSQEVGLGLPLWLPKGMIVRDLLVDFLKAEQANRGYQQVCTPHIGHKKLYMRSGHYEKYKESAFQPIQTPHADESYLLKPMNCPHHCEIYKAVPRSYKTLPIRLAEFGTVYRYEQHGELLGLARTRSFTQDDAHIFCTPEQVESEIIGVLELVKSVLSKLRFKVFDIQVSVRDLANPENYIGSKSAWEKAEKALINACKRLELPAKVVAGEAAFYGPKIDFMVEDALGRQWQLGTVQLDYQLPKRFELTYTTVNNSKQTPVLIHRAPFGSIERFVALLLEHTGGRLPFWLAPVQLAVLPLSQSYATYALETTNQLSDLGYRATCYLEDEKIGKKIRKQELMKTPIMMILGENEQKNQTYTLRRQGEGKNIGTYTWSSLKRFLAEEATT